jgi:FecR-like protein/putative zinc finger protein
MSRFDNDNRDHRDDLERAVAEVLSEPLDDRQVEEAAARVWRKLVAATPDGIATLTATSAPPSTPATSAAPAAQPSPGCADFGHLVPAYLDGGLAPARALLFEDHAGDCLPCRRALHAARQDRAGRAAVPLHEVVEDGPRRAIRPAAAAAAASPAAQATDRDRTGRSLPRSRSRRTFPWARRFPGGSPWLAAAALLLVGLGLALFRTLGMGAAGGHRMARVETVDGRLYRIAGASSVAVAAGDAVREGEQVRTAKDSRAVLRMNDGSQIEMAERAGLSLAAGRGGNTIELERGRIIVQAARQRPRHLYVATDDCLVSVTGTIFAVNHGTKGSRVSVVEGEVHVSRQASAASDTPGLIVLHPGDQATTSPNVAAVPVRQEVAWSRDASRYDALLAELGAAGRAIDAQVARPALRTSSRLLDLVPAGSLVYLALPNLSANLAQTQQLLEQRLAESPVLQQWWSATLGSPANEQLFHDLVQQVGDVGQDLGDEVVIAAGSAAGAAGSGACSGPPVLLAEAIREEPLRATLRQEVTAVNRRAGKTALVLLDQLPDAGPAGGSPAPQASGPLLVWVGQGLLVASPSASQIVAVAANLRPGAANPFTGSSFHARLAQAYADGAGWLFGADLKQLVAGHRAAAPSRMTDAIGLFDLEHFVLEHHDGAAPTPTAAAAAAETRAALTFSQQRRGIASWLAAPAPMGSLGFFSADANLVAAFVVKSPVDLLDELLSLSPDLAAELAKTEAAHGFNLRDDFAAPLGGEIALGLDGPLLPSPSWQLVAEVYDPVRLQQTFARTVQQVNAEQLAAGKPGVALQQEQDGDRTYYAIVSSGPPLEVHYLFADGYLVAAPTRAQLDRALAQRAAGTTLAASPRLRGLLGRDGQVNVSALFYQNLASIAPITGALGAAADASGAAAFTGNAGTAGGAGGTGGTGGAVGRHGLGGLLFGATRGPSLLYAYAEADRIVFAGHSEAGPMGLNLETLAGFGGILGGIERAHGAAMLRRGGQ